MINKHFVPFNHRNSSATEEETRPVSECREPQAQGAATDGVPRSGGVVGDSYVSIKNWAEEDRPREKLMAKGAAALTNAELLAILIGGGTTRKSAVELMREVLQCAGNTIRGLNHMTLQDLLCFNGIGEAKALTLIAAAEIGRRRLLEDCREMTQVRSGAEVLKYMTPLIQELSHEASWALLLNNNARVLHVSALSTGGLTETVVDVRMLLKEALLHNATCFILVHNHPSGNMHPSRHDDELTRRVAQASQTLNIRMLDHVIVTEGDYYSYAENGKI